MFQTRILGHYVKDCSKTTSSKPHLPAPSHREARLTGDAYNRECCKLTSRIHQRLEQHTHKPLTWIYGFFLFTELNLPMLNKLDVLAWGLLIPLYVLLLARGPVCLNSVTTDLSNTKSTFKTSNKALISYGAIGEPFSNPIRKLIHDKSLCFKWGQDDGDNPPETDKCIVSLDSRQLVVAKYRKPCSVTQPKVGGTRGSSVTVRDMWSGRAVYSSADWTLLHFTPRLKQINLSHSKTNYNYISCVLTLISELKALHRVDTVKRTGKLRSTFRRSQNNLNWFMFRLRRLYWLNLALNYWPQPPLGSRTAVIKSILIIVKDLN